MGRVVSAEELTRARKQWRNENRKVVFTNGCFDIIHRGHIEYLTKAKTLGDVLVVGINTDQSVQRIKGNGRPIVQEEDRGFIVANLVPVDYVCFFKDDTPLNLITQLLPDVLVKGADWDIDDVVGKDVVEKHGGRVATIEVTPNQSTTRIIQKILDRASR
jgi:rfaE bifunctional protein nucleotidyltransferase chain/domain